MEQQCGPIYVASSRNQFEALMKARTLMLSQESLLELYKALSQWRMSPFNKRLKMIAKRLLGRADQV